MTDKNRKKENISKTEKEESRKERKNVFLMQTYSLQGDMK
jgi:hypothetical protein